MKYWIYIICEDKYITMSPFGDIYPLSLIWVKIESKNNSVLTTNVLCNIKLESVMTILFKTILYLYFHLDQIIMVYIYILFTGLGSITLQYNLLLLLQKFSITTTIAITGWIHSNILLLLLLWSLLLLLLLLLHNRIKIL